MSAFPDLRARDRAGLAEIFRHYGEIEAMVERLPKDAVAVLFATQVLYQILPEGRKMLVEGIARASRGRPLDLLLLESSGEGDSRLEWLGFESGLRTVRRTLARCDSQGRWIDWGAT